MFPKRKKKNKNAFKICPEKNKTKKKALIADFIYAAEWAKILSWAEIDSILFNILNIWYNYRSAAKVMIGHNTSELKKKKKIITV